MRQLIAVPPSDYKHILGFFTDVLDQQRVYEGAFWVDHAVVICNLTEEGWQFQVWEAIH